MDNLDKKQTIVEHLSELRKRLIYSVIFLLIFTVISYKFSEIIVTDMINKAPSISFIFIAPAELFMSYIKIAFMFGAVLAFPVILYNIWMFLRPGLNTDERKLILRALISGSFLFIIGAIFGYLVVLPMTINFFTSFQIEEIRAMISFSNYLSFTTSFILAFGLVFEVPIIMVIVVKLGITNTEVLKQNKKVAVLIIFILAAILTPPDVVSQTLLAIPMIILFEIGLYFAKAVEKKKNKENEI